MRIYTKTGDKGTTRLVDGSCVEKFNPRVEAYGCIDELNSTIGLALSEAQKSESLFQPVIHLLNDIQSDLFVIGSLMATVDQTVMQKLPQLKVDRITALEKGIDHLTEELPTLKNFILPGGHELSSRLHMARTACRRAERRCSEIQKAEQVYENCLIYLNRLSDLLFTQARWVQLKTKSPEKVWISHGS